MKEERTFLASNITDNMFEAVSDGQHVLVPDRTAITVKDLVNVRDLKTSITHRGLLGSLKKLGISFTQVAGNKFQIQSGDIIYVVIPGGNISPYRDAESLPEDILLKTVSKWVAFTVEEYNNYINVKNKL